MEFDLVKLREFMVNNFRLLPDEICLCSDLKNDLGLEIWDRIELIVFMETTYKVKFPDDATSRYETLFEIIAFVSLESYHLPQPFCNNLEFSVYNNSSEFYSLLFSKIFSKITF